MATTDPTPGRPRPGRPRGFRKGAVKFSKAFLRRVDDARALTSAIEVFKTQVAEGLGERLSPELAEGEALPDFGLALDLVGRSVESALERVRVAERRCIVREGECAAVRRASEKLSRREVYPKVVLVRRLIDAQLGKEEGRGVHGMTGKTLRKARRLHGQLQPLVWALGDWHGELPAPLPEAAAAKRQDWLGEIEPGYDRLTAMLDDLDRLELLEQGARDEKNEAKAAFDAAYGEALRLVQAHFAFAGYGDTLAAKLRSYFQRRRLRRQARAKRQARAEGRVQQTLRSVADWISRRPKNVA